MKIKPNAFIDMDGVVAKYDKNIMTNIYKEKFFLNRPPMNNNIKLVKKLIKDKRFNTYILTKAFITPKCEEEKREWIEIYIPEMIDDKVLVVPWTVEKSDFINKNLPESQYTNNFLVDDHSPNLHNWEENGDNFISIKMLNELNGKKGTWKGLSLKYDDCYIENYDKLTKIILERT